MESDQYSILGSGDFVVRWAMLDLPALVCRENSAIHSESLCWRLNRRSQLPCTPLDLTEIVFVMDRVLRWRPGYVHPSDPSLRNPLGAITRGQETSVDSLSGVPL